MGNNLSIGEVRPEHLTGLYEELYKALTAELTENQAMRATVAIARLYGGEAPYFPTISSITNELRDSKIRKEFNGSNLRELSKKIRSIAFIRSGVIEKETEVNFLRNRQPARMQFLCQLQPTSFAIFMPTTKPGHKARFGCGNRNQKRDFHFP